LTTCGPCSSKIGEGQGNRWRGISRSPQTNGLCERFHRTVKEEFFTVAFRQNLYLSVDQLQADLDRYLNFYNREHCHQSYLTKGRTP